MFVITIILVLASAIWISAKIRNSNSNKEVDMNIVQYVKHSDMVTTPKMSARAHVALGAVRVNGHWVAISDDMLSSMAWNSLSPDMDNPCVRVWRKRDYRFVMVWYYNRHTGLVQRATIRLGYKTLCEAADFSGETLTVLFSLLLGEYASDYEGSA